MASSSYLGPTVGGATTAPGGSSGEVQYNNSGSLGGFGDWDGSLLTVPGSVAVTGGRAAVDISDPTDIADLALWLDASDVTTINAGSPVDNDPVSTWADKSGNGYNATATITELQLLNIVGASSGQYELSSAMDTTAPIAWNASAATIQSELEALSDIGSGNVTVSVVSSQIFLVTFIGALAGTDVAELSPTQDTLDVAPSITTSRAGQSSPPTYVTPSLFGNVAAVRFDGSENLLMLSGAALDLLRNQSGFTVAAQFLGNSTTVFVVENETAFGQAIIVEYSANGQLLGGDGDQSAESGVSNGIPPSVGRVSFSTPWVDGVPTGMLLTQTPVGATAEDSPFSSQPQPATANVAAAQILVGGWHTGERAEGDLAELVVFQRALNGREVRQLLEYLAVKWGTP